MKAILTCLVLLISATPLVAQRPDPSPSPQFEYGSIDDLHGVTRIYVYRGEAISIRNSIVKTIQKHKGIERRVGL
jgi:hypothetical protein